MQSRHKNAQRQFSKMITAACVRRGELERLHLGITPFTRSGDYSDVKVIDANGREICWNEVSRINQDEMKVLMIGVGNRVYTFLARTIFSETEDLEFNKALDRRTVPWVEAWNEPEYLPGFLMPPSKRLDLRGQLR